MPIFGMFDPTVILLIPAILLTLYAQGKVTRAYRAFSGVANRRGITGAQAARRVSRLMSRDMRFSMGQAMDCFPFETRLFLW